MVTLTKMFSGKKKERGENREKSRSSLYAGPADAQPGPSGPAVASGALADTPEDNVRRAIRGFCESGVKDQQQSGEEFLYLPTIVDSAECSPTAAAEAAKTIRKYLDMKYSSEPQLQYNAVMLMRILADNPGRTFTRNLDEKFAEKVKELLKHGRDMGVRQLLIETLEYLDVNKADDEGLQFVRAVWHKQKAIIAKYQPQAPMFQSPPPMQRGQLQQMVNERTSSRRPARTSLPPLEELVGRISEAQMSAKLLHQVLGSTPRNEILENELVKEFVHRCRSASTSMADFITCDSPPPDQDTLQTLIETNDIIRIALARFDAIKESIEMTQPKPVDGTRTPPLPEPTHFPVVDPAARNEGPPDLDNPFQDPLVPPPLVFPGGRHSSRSPVSTGRVTRIHTGGPPSDTSPVSPVSSASPVETRTGFRY